MSMAHTVSTTAKTIEASHPPATHTARLFKAPPNRNDHPLIDWESWLIRTGFIYRCVVALRELVGKIVPRRELNIGETLDEGRL